MALKLIFADSFAHYDTAGIGLKWTTAGGSIETNPARVRTGPQSLKIQAGNSPTLMVAGLGVGYCLVGFAWQTQSLAGETMIQLYDSGSASVQLYLVQNSNGSVSLWSAQGPTLLGSSPAGTLKIGAWTYFELTVNLNVGLGVGIQAVLTVTSSATNVATQVINVLGFATSQTSFDTVVWVGPAALFAWVADFYAQYIWDGNDDPLAVLGAPKIYGLNVPVQDGLDFIHFNTIGKTMAFDGTPAPWWSQVNTIPEQTAIYIYETDNLQGDGSLGGWIVCAQAFDFTVAAVPVGSTIAAIQEVALVALGAGTDANESSLSGWIGYSGQPFFDYSTVGSVIPGRGLGNNWSLPFRFYEFGTVLNPVTTLPFVLSDFTAPSPLQFGLFIGEPG